MNNDISISLVGLSDKEKTVMNVAMSLLGAYDISTIIADGGNGQIAILDAASSEGQQHLKGKPPGQICIVISDDAGSDSDSEELHIKRPVMVQTIKNQLVEVIKRLKDAPAVNDNVVKTAPAAKAAVSPVSTEVASGANATLFYTIVQAVEQQQMLRIECDNHPAILVHGPTRYLYSQANQEELCNMAQLPGSKLKTSALEESSFMQGAKAVRGRSLGNLLWSMMVLGGKGNPLPDDVAGKNMRLKAWPRIKPAYAKTEYLTVAIYLLKQGLTPAMVEQRSGIGMPIVNDFFRTALLLGMLEEQVGTNVVAASPQKSETKGLLGKIMRHLARKKG